MSSIVTEAEFLALEREQFILNPLGGSGGLSKWVNKWDNQAYYMGYRGYLPT